MTAPQLLAVMTALCALGCGSDEEEAQSCAGYEPQASRAELAATPRADATAELLALEASGALVAPEALYQRIAADRARMIELAPEVAYVTPHTDAAIDDLRIELDPEGWKAVQGGSYGAWDCPNQSYGAKVTLNEQWKFAALSFGEKRYAGALLVAEYESLPHVSEASRDLHFYDGPDACLEIQGDRHYYIFDEASGDCPAGCMYHHYFGFQGDPGAPVEALGSFDPQLDATPVWFTELVDCRSRL